MNDFTKEDLIYMKESVTYLTDACCDYAADTIGLEEKIQTKIDSYCEHKNQNMDCDGGISMVCADCGITTVDII